VTTDFGWLPFMDYTYAAFGDTVGKAIADRTELRPALEAWEADLISYAEDQGFTVE